MTDRTLFDGEPPNKLPHNRTDTSRLSAELAKPFANQQLARVYHHFVDRGDDGTTDEEQQDALNMTGNSQRPRRCRLVNLGLVKDSGNMRRTRAGRPATVWVRVRLDQPPVADSKADWPTGGKSNPNKSDSAEFVPDFAI